MIFPTIFDSSCFNLLSLYQLWPMLNCNSVLNYICFSRFNIVYEFWYHLWAGSSGYCNKLFAEQVQKFNGTFFFTVCLCFYMFVLLTWYFLLGYRGLNLATRTTFSSPFSTFYSAWFYFKNSLYCWLLFQVGNMVFWCFFCIVGQPMCVLLYYHDMINRKTDVNWQLQQSELPQLRRLPVSALFLLRSIPSWLYFI